MKSFFVVLGFELSSYFKNKVYLISTLVLSLIIGGVLTVPRIIDMFSSDENSSAVDTSDPVTYGYYDEIGLVSDEAILEMAFGNSAWVKADSKEALSEMVKDEKVKAGFAIDEINHYDYYVLDTTVFDYTSARFTEVMNSLLVNQWLVQNDVDIASFQNLQAIQVTNGEVILGKDGASNYFYTYILIMVLYMMVLLYGQNIATSIASEKSNRAVEILATSTSSTSLIFGKIIAGALAGIIQFAILIATSLVAYKFNASYWNGALDFLFNIPMSILVSFAVFGFFGYLLYAFLFGMVGAMAQKTEDINSTSMPITIVYILAFIACIFAIDLGNETLMAVVSYVPLSSFMGMFARMAMTHVPFVEVALSLVILVVSTGLIGLLASKIYRTGLLMYGNKITFKSIFQQMKNNH